MMRDAIKLALYWASHTDDNPADSASQIADYICTLVQCEKTLSRLSRIETFDRPLTSVEAREQETAESNAVAAAKGLGIEVIEWGDPRGAAIRLKGGPVKGRWNDMGGNAFVLKE